MEAQIQRIKQIYRDHVLAHRTREVRLLGHKCQPRIMYTFLGFEVKLGRKRITCPDLVTARYLTILGELGMATAQVPYDPTRTARLLPELERAFDQIKETLLTSGYTKSRHQLELRKIYRRIRRELEGLGRYPAS